MGCHIYTLKQVQWHYFLRHKETTFSRLFDCLNEECVPTRGERSMGNCCNCTCTHTYVGRTNPSRIFNDVRGLCYFLWQLSIWNARNSNTRTVNKTKDTILVVWNFNTHTAYLNVESATNTNLKWICGGIIEYALPARTYHLSAPPSYLHALHQSRSGHRRESDRWSGLP